MVDHMTPIVIPKLDLRQHQRPIFRNLAWYVRTFVLEALNGGITLRFVRLAREIEAKSGHRR